jgi:hypothetical protein
MPSLPLTIDIPNIQQRLLRQAREDTYNIQSLDPATRTLTVLPWYVVHRNDDHL